MAIVLWVGITLFIAIIGWATWKLAVRIDTAEKLEQRWEEYIREIERVNPQRANWLRWAQENGDEMDEMQFMQLQMQYGFDDNNTYNNYNNQQTNYQQSSGESQW